MNLFYLYYYCVVGKEQCRWHIFNYVYIYCIMDVLDFITALGAYLCFTVQPYLWIVHPWNLLSTYSVTSTEHNYVVYTNISVLLQDIDCEKSPFQSVFCVLDIQTPPWNVVSVYSVTTTEHHSRVQLVAFWVVVIMSSHHNGLTWSIEWVMWQP